jgi:hypothetical protein
MVAVTRAKRQGPRRSTNGNRDAPMLIAPLTMHAAAHCLATGIRIDGRESSH